MPVLNKDDKILSDKYNTFVKNSPFTNATQDIGWAYVKKGWESEFIYLENEKSGEIIAAMSIIFKKTIKNYTLAYAPRGPVCDPYDIKTIKALIKHAQPALKKHKAFVLRFDPEIVFDEALVLAYEKEGFIARNVKKEGITPKELIQPVYNMMLKTDGKSFDELVLQFSEKTRYNIRYSIRKGISVKHSRKIEDLKTFYDIYKTTTIRDGIGARPFDYFARMLEVFDENEMRIYIASHEEQPLSGAIAINYGYKMWYMYGASCNEKRNLMPNYSMQMEMIKWGIEENKNIYDFGGVFVLDKS
ncbi:MAG: peptidoglycan bridge formation glycyltransferase FemA/FemB family protein, partial [Oscillospiraceae bacterium]